MRGRDTVGREPKLDAAVKACDTSTATVLAFVKELGVEEKDVQSDFIAIQPHFPVNQGVESLVPSHFQASRGFAVRLRDVAKFDALLSGYRDRFAGSQNIVQDMGPVGAAGEGETEQKLAAGMIGVTSSVSLVFVLE